MSEAKLPKRARCVIVGGGIVGCSVAYHLTKLGWTDVVVLEQGRLSSGTTWHAAGLVGQLRAHEGMTQLIRYSTQLYASLEAETGLGTGWKQCGSITVARTEERMIQLRRTVSMARAYGVEAEVITAQRAQELWPVMQVNDVLGAVWLPGDGKANPTDLTQALAKGARTRGAKIFEKVQVTGITVKGDAAVGVESAQGNIACDVVVNCAGQWA
ncbi:FAD-binding oxidoreductase, partial [Oceanospirillaceae bacterium]|nr:FAD-binding oxidoreductase [Oceanospirillaceae bacterium]